MNRQILAFVCSMVCGCLMAQVRQQAQIFEYQGAKPARPIAGVSLAVANAPNVVSDDAGQATLSFVSLHYGDPVQVRRVEKAGYEVFNKQALDQWTISSRDFRILLCRSDQFKALRDHYMQTASENYKKQFERDKQALQAELDSHAIDAANHQRKLEELQADYDRQLGVLENYVDNFARIDLSELTEQQAKLIELVNQGNFDEAIRLYEAADYQGRLEKETKDIARISSSQDKLTGELQQREQNRQKLLSAINRQVTTYQLAGGRQNCEKAHQLLKRVVDTDTTSVEALHLYLDYCALHGFKEEQFAYSDIILRHCDDMMKIRVYTQMASVCLVVYDSEGAIKYIEEGLKLAEKHEESSSSLAYRDAIVKLGSVRLSLASQVQDTLTERILIAKVRPVVEELYRDNPERYIDRYTDVVYTNAEWIEATGGDVQTAYTMIEDQIALLETFLSVDPSLNDRIALGYNTLQVISSNREDYPRLLKYSKCGYEIDKKEYQKDPLSHAYAMLISANAMIEAYLHTDDMSDCPRLYDEGIACYKQVVQSYGDVPVLIYLLESNIADYYHLVKDSAQASTHAHEALKWYDQMDEASKAYYGTKLELLRSL